MSLTRHLHWLLLAVPLLLAGCAEVQSPGGGSAGTVGPGTGKVDLSIASIMFMQVCANTYPDIEAARKQVLMLPFAQHPQTGTYYHKNLDLSFKLTNTPALKACSMVLGTSDRDSGPLALGMAAGVMASGAAANSTVAYDPDRSVSAVKLKRNGEFVFQPTSRSGNRTYYNAIMKRG